MCPAPRHPKPADPAAAAAALIASAPLVTRLTERLLAQLNPPLTVAQYLALSAIAEEPLTAADLARRTGVSGPAVSQLVTGLVTAGWVNRAAAAGDRRRQELGLTEAGRRALVAAQSLLTARLSELIAGTPGPELDALARALPTIRAALAGTPPPRRPRPPAPPPPGGVL